MDELERLGRNTFEKAGQVVAESLDQAWVALQPLIELMFARLEALKVVMQFYAIIFIHFWSDIFLQPALDELGKGVGESIARMVLIGSLLVVGGGILLTVLAIAVAVILDRRSRRRSTDGPNV